MHGSLWCIVWFLWEISPCKFVVTVHRYFDVSVKITFRGDTPEDIKSKGWKIHHNLLTPSLFASSQPPRSLKRLQTIDKCEKKWAIRKFKHDLASLGAQSVMIIISRDHVLTRHKFCENVFFFAKKLSSIRRNLEKWPKLVMAY